MPTAKEPKTKRAPRTAKEKAFAKEYVRNGGNGTKAALKVYTDNPNSARSIAAQKLAKLSVVEMMDKIKGLTAVDRLKCLAEGLYAMKQVSGIGDANSRTVEFVEVPDYASRYKYLELSFKLDGTLKNQVEHTGKNGGPIQTEGKVTFSLSQEG